jgi:hypothetical protein
MSKPTGLAQTALACTLLGLACAPAPAGQGAPAAKRLTASADVFGLTKVHELHLHLSPAEWEKMQAVVGGMMFPGGPGGKGGKGGSGGPKQPAAKKPDAGADVHKGSGFGMQFPWAHADLTADGTTYPNVAVRYKGNASYMATSRGLKRNFKIELDRYESGQRFCGLKTLTLNAGGMDPERLREALSYAVFRAAGVPAPRTAFALVTLTVPGKYDKELLGLYTLIESVDKTFLADRFGTTKGVLMKPEGVRGIDYLGDD